MLDVVKLETLRTVVQCGSFSAAARALHLTQPAVSRQVAGLERRLDTPLVHRDRGNVTATPAGLLLLEHAAVARDRLELAERQVRALARQHAGPVRLGSFFSALVHLSAEVGSLLTARHPRLVLADHLVDRPTALGHLARGQLDLAVVFDLDALDPAVVPDGVVLVPLFSDPVRVLLPAHHRLAGRPSVDLADLADDTWIRAHDGTAARLVDHVLGARGLQPEVVLAGRGDEPVEAQALVAAGRGVTLTYGLSVVVNSHQLVVVPVEALTTARTVYAALPEGRRAPEVEAVLDALLDVGRRHRAAARPVDAPADGS